MGGLLAVVMILVLGALVLVGGLQWITDRSQAVPRQDADRLDRIETALTSLEARLDDLQDQQRFLERLLADRDESPALEPGDPDGAVSSRDREAGEAPDDVDSILFETDEGEERSR